MQRSEGLDAAVAEEAVLWLHLPAKTGGGTRPPGSEPEPPRSSGSCAPRPLSRSRKPTEASALLQNSANSCSRTRDNISQQRAHKSRLNRSKGVESWACVPRS
jgi:hypothetical protein